MDNRLLYEVVFYYRKNLRDGIMDRDKMIEVWTAATLASRLTNPFFLIVEAYGNVYTDPKVIQTASKIEALALK